MIKEEIVTPDSEYAASIEQEAVGTGIVPKNKTTLQEGKTILTHASTITGDLSASTASIVNGDSSSLDKEIYNAARKQRLEAIVQEDLTQLDPEVIQEVVNAPVLESQVINDALVDETGNTIHAEEVSDLDSLARTIDTQLTLPYFDNTPMDNAISIAQTVIAGAYEQYNLSEIVKDLTGIRSYGTTDSMNVLADYMYTATPEDRARVLNKTIDLFNKGEVATSQFVRMSLLTALSGQNMSNGGWDTAMYLLDALDLIPVVSGVSKLGKAGKLAKTKGVRIAAKAVGNDVLDAFKYKGTGIKKKIRPDKKEELTKEFQKAIDELTREDVGLTAKKGTPIEVATESSVEKGNTTKAKLLTDKSRPLQKAEVANRVGTTEGSIKQQMLRFRVDGEEGLNSYMNIGAADLAYKVKQELGSTSPVLRETFTDVEKANALRKVYRQQIAALKDAELATEQFIIVSKGGDVLTHKQATDIINNKKHVPGSDEGFYLRSIVGKTVRSNNNSIVTKPFSTVKEAVRAMDYLKYEHPNLSVDIVVRTPGTGEIAGLTQKSIDYLLNTTYAKAHDGLKDKLYLRVTTEHDYNVDDVMGYLTDIDRGYSNEIASAIWSDAAKKDWDLLDMTQRMITLSAKYGKELLNEFHTELKGISKRALIEASKIADYGNRIAKEWTNEEIAEMLKTSKTLKKKKFTAYEMAEVVKAYRAFRNFADTLWEIENDAANRILTQHKIKTVVTPDGVTGKSIRAYVQELDTSDLLAAYNKVLSTADGGGNGVLWRFEKSDVEGAVDGYRTTVGTFEDFVNLVEDPDITIVKSIDNTYGYGVTEEALAGRAKYNYTYMIVDKRTGFEIADAPKNPIPKRPGWVPSKTLENVFVRVPLRVTVNDVVRKVTVTLGGYRNMKAAKAAIEAYKKEVKELIDRSKGIGEPLSEEEQLKLESIVFETGYEGDIDKLLIKAEKDVHAPESNLHRLVDDLRDGKLIGVPRKKMPLLFEESRGAIRLQNPIEAFEDAAMTIGRLHAGYDEHLALLRERFLQRYGSYLQHPEDYNSNWLDPSSDMALRGEEYRRNITRMHTLGERPDRLMQGMLWNLAAYIDELNGNNKAITKLVELGYDASRHFTPIVTAKSIGFTLMLGLNTFRQLLMQASAFSFIAAIDGKAAAKAVPDGTLLMAAALAKPDSAFYKKGILTAAKARGWDITEFENLVKEYKASGIPDGMDMHMMQVEQLHSASMSPVNTGSKMLDSAVYIGRAAKVIPKISTAVGFNAGEALNLATTFAFQFHRMKKDGVNFKGIYAKDNYKTLSTSTMALALSPNKNGAYSLQRDWFAWATQYMAFQFKALEFLLYGSKHKKLKIDKAARARMAGMQLILWGSEGLGLQWVWENYVKPAYIEHFKEEPDEDIENFIKGGIADLTINAMADAIVGDEEIGRSNKIRVSESFSPLPRTIQGIADLIQYGFEDPGASEVLLGPIASLPGTIGRALTDIHNVFVADVTYDSPSDRAVDVFKAIARVAPLYKNVENSILPGILSEGYSNLILSYKTGEGIVHATSAEQLVYGLFGIKNDAQLDLWESQKYKYSNIRKAKELADAAAVVANRELIKGPLTQQRFNEAVKAAKPLLEIAKVYGDSVHQKAVARFRKKLLTSNTTEGALFENLAKEIVNSSKPLDAASYLLSKYGSGMSREDKAKLLERAAKLQEFISTMEK